MKSSSINGRNLVKVDAKRAQASRQKFNQYQAIYKDEQSKFKSPAESEYYIVSKKYLKQWEQFCLSNEVERYQPRSMNDDLMDAGGQLRINLLQVQDYDIVNQKIYNLVRGQSGFEIRRKAVYRGTEKKVPLYLQIIKYVKLQYKDLRNIDYKNMNLSDLKMKQLQFSNEDTIENLKAEIKNRENLYRVKLRLWVNNHNQTSLQDLFRYIKNKTNATMSTTYRFDGKGKLIQNLNAIISDLDMKKDSYFIVQVCDQYSNYFFKSDDEAKCQGCYKYRTLPYQCGCKVVSYCSQQCQEKDKRYHMKDCKYAQQQQLNEEIQMKVTSESRLGVVGLSNLGNTCFMNSCLQCLSHTRLLSQYFLNKYFEKEINKDNPLGSQGRLAKNYAKFIKNMWCSSYDVYSPHSLKGAVAKLNPMFSGFAQHDSQQFFSFLVDGIHEDLNRVAKKPYVQSTESKNRPDQIVALQSWIAHTQRNQSIIVDLFTGQYKSRVICPKCKLQSITFDPFTTVSLPLPEQQQSKLLKYYILPSSTENQTKRYGFQYKKIDANEWLMTASKMQKRSSEDFLFYILTMTQNIYNLSKTGKTEIKNKIQNEQKNVFLLELTPEQKKIEENNRLQLVTRICQKSRYQNQCDALWFKRPFFYDKNTTVALDIVKNIIRYLYGVYTQKKVVNFQTYFQKMMKERPFTLSIQYQKKTQSYINRKTISYQKSYSLNEDSKKIIDVINEYSLTEYQIDVIFTKQSASYFQFQKLKSFTDKLQSQSYKKGDNKYEKNVSLDECFSAFQQIQQLQPGNEWYCPKCKQHTLATKEMTIYKAPQILIFQLKRFKNKGILRKQKNQATVLFPTSLNMKQYLISPQPMSSYISLLKKQKKYIEPVCKIQYNPNSQPIYELYAISNHYGGLGGGHYTAYAKNRDKWYEFNDSSVKKVSEQSIKGSGAYLLFYSRVNNMKIK